MINLRSFDALDSKYVKRIDLWEEENLTEVSFLPFLAVPHLPTTP